MAIVFPASPSVNDTFTEGSITYKWDGAKWIGLGVTPADRLVEGSNKLEIDANNNLVYSGGKVGVNQGTPTSFLHTKSGANDGTVISTFEGATNNKLDIKFIATGPAINVTAGDPLVFEMAGSEKLRITSSGQLITKGRIFINNTNAGFDYNTTANTLEVLITNGSTHSEFNSGAFVPSGSKNLGASGARWSTVYANTFNVATGIDFSSTGNAGGMQSEILDDYEEGNWTPSWGSTTGSFTSVSYLTQSGRYTKIGNRVFIDCQLRSSATTIGTAGGALLVTGLPFTCTTSQGTGGAAAYSLFDFSNSGLFYSTETRENTTQFFAAIGSRDNNTFFNEGPGSLQGSGNSEIRVQFCYKTDD